MEVKAETGVAEIEAPLVEQPVSLEFVTSIKINPQSVNIGTSHMNRKFAQSIEKSIAPLVQKRMEEALKGIDISSALGSGAKKAKPSASESGTAQDDASG